MQTVFTAPSTFTGCLPPRTTHSHTDTQNQIKGTCNPNLMYARLRQGCQAFLALLAEQSQARFHCWGSGSVSHGTDPAVLPITHDFELWPYSGESTVDELLAEAEQFEGLFLFRF